MTDTAIGAGGLDPLRSLPGLSQDGAAARPGEVEGKDFKTYLLESLDKVNQLQTEADAGVQRLLTGESNNVAEVLSASRKAGVAFDMLMEIRNKLMDAYTEVRQMRV